jgi:hypothetical protein
MGVGTDIPVPADPSSLCRPPATRWNNNLVTTSGGIRRASLFGIFTLFSLLSGAVNFTIPTNLNSISTPTSPFQSTIVGSHHARHNSTALCSNPWSYGPDFVSFHEGVYCDMETRRIWPLCNTTKREDCYDWDTRTLVNQKLKKRRMGYNDVIEWK